MPVSVLISKIRVYNPNKKSTAVRNGNYIIYIATRPGVDLSNTALDNLTNPVMNGTFNADKELSVTIDDAAYIRKIASQTEQCHGLFGNFDVSDLRKTANDVMDLTRKGTVIYRGIVSLCEEDAVNLGYTDKKSWEIYMRSVINDVADKLGIPSTSLHWCAAVHMEKGHPHCHYNFWRTDGKITSPYIHYSKQHEIREFLSKEMFKDEIRIETKNKTLYRDSTLAAVSSEMNNFINHIHIPDRITEAQLTFLAQDLAALSKALPGKGSLKYAYLPPECKELLNKAVDDVLNIPTVKKEYSAYLDHVRRLSKSYSPSEAHHRTTLNKNDEDIRLRTANKILTSAKELLTQQREVLLNALNFMQPLPLEQEQLSLPDPEETSSGELSSPDSDDAAVRLLLDGFDSVKVRWSKEFKELRTALYELEKDKNNPNYKAQFMAILSGLTEIHNDGNLVATYLLARIYNSQKYPVYNEETAMQLYHLTLTGFEKELPLIQKQLDDNNFRNEKEREWQITLHNYLNYHIGKLYHRGMGCEIDYSKAALHYTQCIETNHYAQYGLANIYLDKEFQPLTPEIYGRALDLLQKASDTVPYAAYQYAQNLELPVYKEFAGSHEKIYDNYHKALKGFLEQEKQDPALDGGILYKIGKMYYEGKGCVKDSEKAYGYFLKSAKDKNKHAFYALGKTCADQKSLHYDPLRAEQYYLKAFVQHQPSYLKISMADLYSMPDTEVYNIDKALQLSKDCIETDNDPTAMCRLGRLYFYGNGIEKNEELGIKYLNDASLSDDIPAKTLALFYLGKIYFDKSGNYFNILKAEAYFQRALILTPSPYIRNALADLYATPDQELYNIDKAINIYKISITEASDTFAMSKLGSIYLFGRGVEKNEELGLKYLHTASELGNEYAKETLDFYNNLKHSYVISSAYSIAQQVLRMFDRHQNQLDLLMADHHRYRSTSKEARIDAYKKSQEHSPDFE